jgi:hypothetical protein
VPCEQPRDGLRVLGGGVDGHARDSSAELGDDAALEDVPAPRGQREGAVRTARTGTHRACSGSNTRIHGLTTATADASLGTHLRGWCV